MTEDLHNTIVDDLEKILQQGFNTEKSTDWQQVFDEVTDKFARIIKTIKLHLNNEGYTAQEVSINVTKYILNLVLRFLTKDLTNIGEDKQFGYGRNFFYIPIHQTTKWFIYF